MRILRAAALAVSLTVLGGLPAKVSLALDKSHSGQRVRFQSAGYLGLIAAGYGHLFFDRRMELALFYGYVPEGVGGEIHSIAWKTTYYPCDTCGRILPYAGTNVIYGIAGELFVTTPEQYEDGYYPVTAIHGTLNFGVELPTGSPGDPRALYVEASGLFDAMLAAYINPVDVPLESAFGLGVGYRVTLD